MKMIATLLVAGGLLAGQASAETKFIDIGQDVVVSVQNVCTIGGSAIDSEFDENSSVVRPDSIKFGYKATQASQGSQQVFNIRCTAGTNPTLTRTSEGGRQLGVGANTSATTLPKVGSKTAVGLNVNLTETLTETLSDGTNTSPDRYRFNVRVQAPAGQWGVTKGDYSTVLVYRFSYEE